MEISRRTLIGSSIAASTAASTIVVTQPARAAGNVMRIAIGSSLNNLDPMMTTIGDEYIYDNLAFNGLTRMREDLVAEFRSGRELEASATTSRPGPSRSRRGVKFHDGSEMMVDDVVAFFKRLLDPANTKRRQRSQYDMVEDVSAIRCVDRRLQAQDAAMAASPTS